MKSVNDFTAMCIRKGYVSEERAPWLQYALDKRVISTLISIPILVLGFILVPPAMATSFYLSFYLLRVRTNGFHANSALTCFVLSLFSVALFLGVLPKILSSMMELILFAIATVLIYRLAPYNHPNMAMTENELAACAHSAKLRLIFLSFFVIACLTLHLKNFAQGTIFGIIMVALSLAFAHYAELVI